jgi:hypothetical protein
MEGSYSVGNVEAAGTSALGSSTLVEVHAAEQRQANESEQSWDEAPAGLFERSVRLAKELGIDWPRGGGGIYRCQLDAGAEVWRAYSDWCGTGAIVDVDVSSGVVMHVQAREFDHIGCGLGLPAQLRPTEDEVLSFVRDSLDKLGWVWPPLLFGHWDEAACTWRVGGTSVAHHFGFEAEVHGRRGRLCLARMSRT